MKYLRKIFESQYNDDDIKEICYDLTDDKGFQMRITDSIDVESRKIIISKPKSRIFFIDYDVRDVLLRLADYLGDNFIKLSMKIMNGEPMAFDGTWEEIQIKKSGKLSISDNKRISSIIIWIKR